MISVLHRTSARAAAANLLGLLGFSVSKPFLAPISGLAQESRAFSSDKLGRGAITAALPLLFPLLFS